MLSLPKESSSSADNTPEVSHEGNLKRSFMQEQVEFKSGDVLFRGKVFRPDDLDQCKGIIIFTHGLGYCDRQYKIKGDFFAQNGYLMFVYNLRGHASTKGQWTLSQSVEDLAASIDFLTGHFRFKNNEKICVLGHSTGALISLLASLKDRRIKFGSLVTIVTCLRDSYLHWFESGFNQEVKEYFKSQGRIAPIINEFLDDPKMLDRYREGQLDPEALSISHRYGLLKSERLDTFFHEIAYSDDVLKHIDEIQTPLLLFRGEYDEVMDVNKTNELYEKLSPRLLTRFYITDSRNHFHNDRWDLIQEETLRFFDVFCDYRKAQGDFAEKHILIIDDEPLVGRSLQMLLVQNGITFVETAKDGEEALEKIKELRTKKNRSFDLIISDIRMPGIDGIETIKKAKEFVRFSGGADSPVIFITGYEGAGAVERAKQIGYVDYLYKPLDTVHFLASVKKQLQCSNV